MQVDTETEGDPRYYRPMKEPLINQWRAAKGDIFTGPDCKECDSTGKDKMTKANCKPCWGKGYLPITNASEVDSSHIRFAQVQIKSIINLLWDKGIITDDQHHDGGTFQIWRDMHNAALGFGKAVSSGEEESLGIRLRAYGYILLVRRLHPNDIRAVEYTVDTFVNSHTQFLALNRKEMYQGAFERLGRLLPCVKDQVTALESVSDVERNELSEDGLKKLLAQIVKRV